MRRRSWSLVAGLALACSAAFAQQPAPQQPAPQPAPQQPAPQPDQQPPAPQPLHQPGTEQGFFRPAADPVITPAPAPLQRAANIGRSEPAPLPPEVARAFAAQVEAREALERDLDRAQREAARAQAEAAARRPAPMIVSPLDGTAPIISPLDRY